MAVDISRKELTFKQLKSSVYADIQLGLTPVLFGEPGIGKSSLLETIGEEIGTKVFSLQVNQLSDRSDLTGLRAVEETRADGTKEWTQKTFPHATIADAIDYAKDHPNETPILFFDEINRAGSDITSAVLSFITARQIGTQFFPDNLRFVAAGNASGNVSGMDKASLSRFSLYHAIPDLDTFLEVNPKLNPWVKKTLLAHPETLTGKAIVAVSADTDNVDDDDANVELDALLNEDDELDQITTPRTLSYLSDWLNYLRPEDLTSMVASDTLEPCIHAKVGQTPFALYLLQNIIDDLSTQTANHTSLVKPASYDIVRGFNTISEIQSYLQTLPDSEKSSLLVYCMYARDAVRTQIQSLAPMVNQLEGVDHKNLITLSVSGQLDEQNVRCFLDTNAPVAQLLGTTLELNLG